MVRQRINLQWRPEGAEGAEEALGIITHNNRDLLMITLTTPAQINSVLGGNAPVSYDKLVIGPFNFNPKTLVVNGELSLTATADPEMQEITGHLRILTASARLEISVEQLDFYRRVALTGPQNSAVQTIIRDSQNSLESGLVSLGVIDGTQAPGA